MSNIQPIITPRGGGKTSFLIKRSAMTRAVIVTKDQPNVEFTLRKAKELGVTTPTPISYHDFTTNKWQGQALTGLLVDNVDDLLQYIARSVPVLAFTASYPEEITAINMGTGEGRFIKMGLTNPPKELA